MKKLNNIDLEMSVLPIRDERWLICGKLAVALSIVQITRAGDGFLAVTTRDAVSGRLRDFYINDLNKEDYNIIRSEDVMEPCLTTNEMAILTPCDVNEFLIVRSRTKHIPMLHTDLWRRGLDKTHYVFNPVTRTVFSVVEDDDIYMHYDANLNMKRTKRRRTMLKSLRSKRADAMDALTDFNRFYLISKDALSAGNECVDKGKTWYYGNLVGGGLVRCTGLDGTGMSMIPIEAFIRPGDIYMPPEA